MSPTLATLLLLLALHGCTSQLIWRQKTPTGLSPPARRDAGFGFHLASNSLVLFGGRGASGSMDDTWIYNLTSNVWTQQTPSVKPAPRFSFVSAMSDDKFYVSTGEGKVGDVRTFYNDVWTFDMTTYLWNEMPSRGLSPHLSASTSHNDTLMPTTRYGSAGGVFGNSGKLYVALGFDLTRYSDVFTYDTSAQLWIEEYPDRNPYSPAYPHARCLHSAAMVDSTDFVIFGGCLTGGKTGGACPSGDTWMFQGQKRTWERLAPCAEPRVYSSMAMLPPVSGQRRVILYGGNSGGKQVIKTDPWPKPEVGVFNPDTMEWALKTVSGLVFPDRRMGANMATGTAGIYMFGGRNLETGSDTNDLWELVGTASDTDNLETSRECSPYFMNYLTLHGVFMVLGWGVFLQWGAFVARYVKPYKNPLWFNLHRGFQITGLLLAIIGFALAFVSVQFDHLKFAHGVIGLVVMILGIIQPFMAIPRPHVPEEGERKSRKRWIWEFFHHLIGRCALILALVNISLGVFMAQASKVVYSLWFAYLAVFVAVYIVAEIHRHRRVLTDLLRPEIIRVEDSTGKGEITSTDPKTSPSPDLQLQVTRDSEDKM